MFGSTIFKGTYDQGGYKVEEIEASFEALNITEFSNVQNEANKTRAALV